MLEGCSCTSIIHMFLSAIAKAARSVMSAIWPVTLRRACTARGCVIALGLEYIYIVYRFQKSILTQEGFSSNLMGFSTAL